MLKDYLNQKEANISSLLEEEKYEERILLLRNLVSRFNEKQVKFGLACSANLFLRGIIDDFNDFDFIIDKDDTLKVKEIMDEIGAVLVATGGNGYCESDIYMHYQYGNADIDIIAGFKLVTFGTFYIYNFNKEEIQYVEVEDIKVPLITLEALYVLYYMMEGWQPKRKFKRLLIEEALMNTMNYPSIFNNALNNFKLPTMIKRSVRNLLK